MTFYRLNTKLTAMTDTDLRKATETLRTALAGIDQGRVDHMVAGVTKSLSQMRCRMAVRDFVIMFDTCEYLLTVTHHWDATPETKAWDSWEGGHTYSEKPNMRAILGW